MKFRPGYLALAPLAPLGAAVAHAVLMPKKKSAYQPQPDADRAMAYAEKLAAMIRCDTTSYANVYEPERFERFHAQLAQLFPLVHEKLERTVIDGNLLFYWRGKAHDRPIVLMSHQDVVPAEGTWSHAPFSGDIADGKVWGRGASDTKASLMAFFQAVEELLAAGYEPANDVYLSSSCTEEWAGDGAPKLVAELKRRGVRPFLVCDEGGGIITEPIGGIPGNFAMVGVFEKGKADVKFTAKSTGGHASAPGRHTPIARLADKIAAVFVPVVILVAAGVFCLRYFVLDAGDLRSALNCVCSTLVIACPCALGLATPTSIMTGSGRAAELGVLFRGGEQLETAYKTDTVVFDKTGTLTLGLTDGAEQLRPGAAEAVRALRARGMELWMISGDKREKAERIAGMLGIENVLCEVRPADKSDAVKALQARGKHVCFVGDGINDSPALACADIGVALGCGADIAISTADVMIVSSSMQSVQTVFDISAATMKNVRQNLIWAAVYNVICIPLAASGIINPSIAAAAMALSSNGVLLNALRLKKYEPRNI